MKQRENKYRSSISENEDLLKEAADYFHARPGFRRLFHLMKKKYISLGKIGGTVSLDKPEKDELDALERFFAKPFPKDAPIKVSLKKFEETLTATKFQSSDLVSLLESYFGGPIVTKTMEKQKQARRLEAFFTRYREQTQHAVYQTLWLNQLMDADSGSGKKLKRLLTKAELKEAEQCMDFCLATLDGLLEQLADQQYVYLPLFAQKVTNNPHGLDRNTNHYTDFVMMMQWLSSQEDQEISFFDEEDGNTLESSIRLLDRFYLYKDDIANFASIYGFEATDAKGDKVGWLKNAAEGRAALNLPLREIFRLQTVSPWKRQPVVVIENSGVYSQLISRYPVGISFICGHGHPNWATLMFLDLLTADKSIELFYAGDFDPEGIGIAQRLLDRYPKMVTVWQDNSDWYQCNSADKFTDRRLKKLQKVTHPQLQKVRVLLQKHQVPFYQEQYMPQLLEWLEAKGTFSQTLQMDT